MPLLNPDEPDAYEIHRPEGASPYVLLCDHASHRMPAALGDLGLEEEMLRSHIAWDIGIAALCLRLSPLLDAPLVMAGYSRLAIDPNRPLVSSASVPEISCEIPVPGNRGLADEAREARQNELFWPYHRAVERLLRERSERGQRSAVLSMHSFTPRLFGEDRPWHVGIMYGKDRYLAGLLLDALAGEPFTIGDNQPYQITDNADFSVPVHAEKHRRPGVLIELRQDQLLSDEGIETMAHLMVSATTACQERLFSRPEAE